MKRIVLDFVRKTIEFITGFLHKNDFLNLPIEKRLLSCSNAIHRVF